MSYEKTPIENDKLTLSGPSWDANDNSFKNRPSLKFNARNNSNQIIVFPSHPNEEGKFSPEGKHLKNQPIYIGLNINSMRSMLEEFTMRVKKGEPWFRTLFNKMPIKAPDGSNTGKNQTISSLTYGLNKKGYPFFQVKANDRPDCYFTIRDGYWHKPSDPNSEVEAEDASAARWYAIGYLGNITDLTSASNYHGFQGDLPSPKQRREAAIKKKFDSVSVSGAPSVPTAPSESSTPAAPKEEVSDW